MIWNSDLYEDSSKPPQSLNAKLSDEKEKDRLLRLIGAKYFPEGYDLEADMSKNAGNALILAIKIDHMSGKHVREK